MRKATARLAMLASISLACGGGSGLAPDHLDHDAAASFAGSWYGLAIANGNGQQSQNQERLDVQVTGRNAIKFTGFCGDGDGPSSRVTSDSTFTVAGYGCAVPLGSGCTATWGISGGSGTLVGGQISFSLQGKVTGCGIQEQSLSLSFTGSRNPGGPGNVDQGPPVAAVANATVTTAPNVAVQLDASASRDPDARMLSFWWSVASGPSPATSFTSPSSPQTLFTASVAGTYVVQVAVTASDGQSATASVTVTVGDGSTTLPGQVIPALAHGVSGAEYSRALDRIIMVDGTSSALYVYDPVTATEATVTLPLAPQCLALSPDGLHAIVGHNAYVSYVDLAAASRVKAIPVSADVGDCVLGGNGYAYLFPRVDQWVAIHNVEIATGVETMTGSWQLYAGTRARLHPSGDHLYTVTNGLSPANIDRWSISAGPAAYAWESPYWGDYPMGGRLWITADGARIITSAGTAFRTSATQPQDIAYGGALSGLSSVQHLDSTLTEIAAIPATNPYAYPPSTLTDGTVELFNVDFLGHTDRIALPRWQVGSSSYPTHGRFVFYRSDASRKYVVVQADAASALLRDTAVLTF